MTKINKPNDAYYNRLRDYSILQLSLDQFQRISGAIDIINETLHIDRPVLTNITYQFMINQQISNQKYYHELTGNISQARLVDKFDMSKYVISELVLVLQGTDKIPLIKGAVEKAFEWYVKEFL